MNQNAGLEKVQDYSKVREFWSGNHDLGTDCGHLPTSPVIFTLLKTYLLAMSLSILLLLYCPPGLNADLHSICLGKMLWLVQLYRLAIFKVQ